MLGERLRLKRYPLRATLIVLAKVGIGVGLLASCSSDDSGAERSQASTSESTELTTTSVAVPDIDQDAVILPGEVHVEIQQFTADSFADPHTASGMGATSVEGTVIVVDCVEEDTVIESASSGFYHVIGVEPEGPPELVGQYIAANTFINNSDLSLPLNQQNAVDPAVPTCP